MIERSEFLGEEMTIVESIKCVLQNNHSGLTSKQIYDEIIRRGLYILAPENPVGVVNAQLRRRCAGRFSNSLSSEIL